jgi:hypothetical protein
MTFFRKLCIAFVAVFLLAAGLDRFIEVAQKRYNKALNDCMEEGWSKEKCEEYL